MAAPPPGASSPGCAAVMSASFALAKQSDPFSSSHTHRAPVKAQLIELIELLNRREEEEREGGVGELKWGFRGLESR